MGVQILQKQHRQAEVKEWFMCVIPPRREQQPSKVHKYIQRSNGWSSSKRKETLGEWLRVA